MFTDLTQAVADDIPRARADLEQLVSIPSVSAPGFDAEEVRRAAEVVVDLFTDAGLQDVQLLEVEGAHPAVFGQVPPPPGAPTVLLYAHYDVQPPGPVSDWTTPPFEAHESEDRLYGRGASDDKAGVAMHASVIRAFKGNPPVGVKIFIEGEEEVGSTHLLDFLEAHSDRLAADVIVIADVANWRQGIPSLTTSLRGLVDCTLEVRTLTHAIHSGMFGGPIPDALTCLARMLATLHTEDGEVAVPGLTTSDADPLDLTEAEFRSQAGTAGSLDLVGEGTLTARLWRKPAIAVLAVDAPPIREAINQLVPVARAKISIRLAPGDDPARAATAVRDHLMQAAPWGAEVTVTPGAAGDAYELDATGPAYDAFRRAFEFAYGAPVAEIGTGGSIPFVAAFTAVYPEASILLTGVADPTSRFHGPNESVSLEDFHRGILGEAVALRLLAPSRPS